MAWGICARNVCQWGGAFPAQGCQKFSIVQNLHKLLKSGCCGVLYKDSHAYRWLSAGLQRDLLLSACKSVNLKLCCNDIFGFLQCSLLLCLQGKADNPKVNAIVLYKGKEDGWWQWCTMCGGVGGGEWGRSICTVCPCMYATLLFCTPYCVYHVRLYRPGYAVEGCKTCI